MSEGFAWMYVHPCRVCSANRAYKRLGTPWKWSYEWSLAAIRVLRIEPGTSARATSAHNHKAISLAPLRKCPECLSFLLQTHSLKNKLILKSILNINMGHRWFNNVAIFLVKEMLASCRRHWGFTDLGLRMQESSSVLGGSRASTGIQSQRSKGWKKQLSTCYSFWIWLGLTLCSFYLPINSVLFYCVKVLACDCREIKKQTKNTKHGALTACGGTAVLGIVRRTKFLLFL